MRTALVLGGGGVVGIAWELGVLQGLAELGTHLSRADTLIGTSAGAVVAVRATTAGGVEQGFAAQFELAEVERPPRRAALAVSKLVVAMALPGDRERKLARIGSRALTARTVWSAQQRLEITRSRIGAPEWPERDLRVTAVEAETGRFRVFDRHTGSDLVRAVTASCAVPFVSPPVSIEDKHYLDGSMRSPTNADLAAGCDVVVALAPAARTRGQFRSLRSELEATGAGEPIVLVPDEAGRKTLGINPFDAGKRADAARAGRDQAARLLPLLGAWTS